MPQWLLSTSMLSVMARGLLATALPGADAVGAAEDRGCRHRRCTRQRTAEARVFLVGAAAARHLVDAPGVGRLRAGGKRAAERDHRAHALRHHFCELPRVKTAEAPADQRNLAAVGVVQLMHEIDHRVLHARTKAEVAALAPAADGIAAGLQEAAQRARRGVRRDEAGQYQHRMPIAARREAEQRQCAEEGAEFMDGSPFQEHQGPGRRAKRLCSNGHCISCSGGPLKSRQPAIGLMNDANAAESFRNATLLPKKLWNCFGPFKPMRHRI